MLKLRLKMLQVKVSPIISPEFYRSGWILRLEIPNTFIDDIFVFSSMVPPFAPSWMPLTQLLGYVPLTGSSLKAAFVCL